MSAPTSHPPIDESKLNEFMGKAVGDMGAALHMVLMLIGDRLGIYKAMADSQPVTPAQLAARTGLNERNLREWLNANAAGGYVTYDPATKTYVLPPEQALALAVEESPAFLGRVSDHGRLLSRCSQGRKRLPHRSGHGLARTSSRSLPWNRALLPS